MRELGGSLNELDGVEWNWVKVEMSWEEVDGAEWRWVHGLVIPKTKHFQKPETFALSETNVNWSIQNGVITKEKDSPVTSLFF